MQSKEATSLVSERLKDNVSVVFSNDKTTIAYALWEVKLPVSWVNAQPVIKDLLDRRISRAQALENPIANPLVNLLSAQGCFTSIEKTHYSLKEIKALFDPLRSEWYATYYAHLAWEQIRTGKSNRNVLLAWLIHNYHISRAAGIVAARMASLGKETISTQFFQQDALEEYWHCDAFYSLDTPLLQGVSLADVKSYVPLPGSLAFEEHCLQVAETDPLGHLLIAYFQESSIAFASASNDFYQVVEDQYDIKGLFNTWKQHIQIDVNHGHAEGLGQLLDSASEVEAAVLERALRNAWLGFYFLCCSLDDIQHEQHGDEIYLRLPVEQNVARDLPNLWEALTSHLGMEKFPQTARLRDVDQAFLVDGLCKSAFRALGFARDHDQIIACGGVAKAFSRHAKPSESDNPLNPWSLAITNHLLEAANCPATWLMLTSLLGERLTQFKLTGAVRTCIEQALRGCVLISSSCRLPLTALRQLDELIVRWLGSRDLMPHRLLQI
ncbi:hypothetical protein ABH909_004995 [Pseudomonas sp. BS3782 TE3695]|jgi:hypothetical protein|uniref:hypothetical protein n=1 Tax=Pseudomonas sp. BS3782 TE3695 TaxID=3349323 RepID=UPI003D25F590